MRPFDTRVGHIAVKHRQTQRHQAELQHVEHQPHAAWQGIDQALAGRQGIGCQGQAAPQQQWPEGQSRPVHQHALRQGPGPAHTPDVIELAIDGEHQRQRGQQQDNRARPADLARLACKLFQVQQHGFCNVVGHQTADQPLLQPGLHLPEHGKRAEHRQADRHQRHEGNDGGERQAASGGAQAVFSEALAQRVRRAAPGKGKQRLPQAEPEMAVPGKGCGTVRPTLSGHPAIMPALSPLPRLWLALLSCPQTAP